jgi:hypothetical protein
LSRDEILAFITANLLQLDRRLPLLPRLEFDFLAKFRPLDFECRTADHELCRSSSITV